MTALVRKFSTMLDLLSRGDVGRKCNEELENCLVALDEAPADKCKAELTLKITLNYELGRVDVAADVKSKLPDTARFMKTPFWIDDGTLSTEHPNQANMFGTVVDHDADEGDAKTA